jgi:ABC-type uncharacterized transport system involved in gliding motility auxiliary subunit
MLDPNFDQHPADIDVLMIAHPRHAHARQQLYAIDQFVLGGGRALVFVDPIRNRRRASQPPGGEGRRARVIGPAAALRAWGVVYNPAEGLGDRLRAQRVQVRRSARSGRSSYPIWLHLTAPRISTPRTRSRRACRRSISQASAR